MAEFMGQGKAESVFPSPAFIHMFNPVHADGLPITEKEGVRVLVFSQATDRKDLQAQLEFNDLFNIHRDQTQGQI